MSENSNIRNWAQAGGEMIAAVCESLPSARQEELRTILARGEGTLVAITDGSSSVSVSLMTPGPDGAMVRYVWTTNTNEPSAVDRVTLQ